MAGSRALIALSALVATSSLLYTQFTPFLNNYGGRISDIDPMNHVRHMQHGALNNDKCQTFAEGQGCEDVRIHYPSSTAFLACGFPTLRSTFYPPMNRDNIVEHTPQEYFLKYDIETSKITHLKIVGWDGDLVLHGIDIRPRTDDANTIDFWAVNHARNGEVILLFKHTLGTDTLNFVKEFRHSWIKTPNAVAATGPFSFFISNDHYAYPSAYLGIPRWFQTTFGPFSWATSVVHCEATLETKPKCKMVSPSKSQPGANGLSLVDDGKTLFVNDIQDASTTIYNVDPVSKMLTLRKRVKLGASADNLSEIPGGDMAVCVFPDPTVLFVRLTGDNVLNSSITAPAAVLRLRKDKDYEPEVLYWDDGSLITILTGASVDPVRKKLIAGGFIERHFIVCDIDAEF